MENLQGLLTLLRRMPPEARDKLLLYASNDNNKGIIELLALVGINNDIVNAKITALGGIYEGLGCGFAIITVPIDKLSDVLQIEELEYLEFPKTLFTSSFEANRDSCVIEAQEVYGLTGKGVIIGFVDSGIDYMHPAFRNEDGTTRIDAIYDLSGDNKIYDAGQINEAIKSNDPYSIVPVRDNAGHGTHVAGIAAGGGNIPKMYYGVAPQSSIIMVKFTSPGKLTSGRSTQLMRGINFLVRKANELKKPLVINLSYSTNDGAHDGESILERYISNVAILNGITMVIAAGNEGDAGHHVGFATNKDIVVRLGVGNNEGIVVFDIYKPLLWRSNIRIIGPTGSSTISVPVIEGYYPLKLARDDVYISVSGATPISTNGSIMVALVASDRFLTSGVYTIEMSVEGFEGNFNIWMPISEELSPQTRFLQPNPEDTVGIPGTVGEVITVGAYDSSTGTISTFSGRGGTIKKPDIMAPGVNIESAAPGGGFDVLSGTSMATPMVAGSAALICEYGIVKNFDRYMFGIRLKSFLLKGASRKRTNLSYPNTLWGYGTLCTAGALNLINEISRSKDDRSENLISPTPICEQSFFNEDNWNLIIEFEGNPDNIVNNEEFCFYRINDVYGVVSVPFDRTENFIKVGVGGIINVRNPSIYTLEALNPLITADINKYHNNPYLPLDGNGVLVGIIDTGIDYLNDGFRNEDETSRIVSLWDQTIASGTQSDEVPFGTEYTKEQINSAIKTKLSGGDPYTVVPSMDIIGHGTAMASTIGARSEKYTGGAPNCEFVVVKLKEVSLATKRFYGLENKNIPIYGDATMLMALKYLSSVYKKVKKPMVIFIGMGTNRGAHDGTEIIEQYIDDIARSRGIAIVAGNGNQGSSDTHTSGMVVAKDDRKIIELKVGPTERVVDFQIWFRKPDKVSISIITPSGEVVEKVTAKIKKKWSFNFILEGTTAELEYFTPDEINGDELISIRLVNVVEGLWQFILIGDLIVDGRYNAWLMQRELLDPQTKFLSPDNFTTLTVPSSAQLIISTGFYNQTLNTLVPESSRGYTRDGRVAPDLISGGIAVDTIGPNNENVIISGSSIAGAVLTSAVALLMQWGIVYKKDPTLYAPKIKNYLVRGTNQRPGEIYPNPITGYGVLNMEGIFNNLRSISEDEWHDPQLCDEGEIYDGSNIFIRYPDSFIINNKFRN